jgi:hypothetical protein
MLVGRSDCGTSSRLSSCGGIAAYSLEMTTLRCGALTMDCLEPGVRVGVAE